MIARGIAYRCYCTEEELEAKRKIAEAENRPPHYDLKCWINRPRGTALGMLRDRHSAGYGVLRLCRSGYKVGPLFADSPEEAEHLFQALKARVPKGTPIYLDTPAANPAAVELAERYGMTVVFETARMYRGQSPDLPMDRVFGVTTFELG